jgi:hypothetical protein
MMTLSAGKTYDIFTPSGYFKLNGVQKSNGIHSITTDMVVDLYDEDALYIVSKINHFKHFIQFCYIK